MVDLEKWVGNTSLNRVLALDSTYSNKDYPRIKNRKVLCYVYAWSKNNTFRVPVLLIVKFKILFRWFEFPDLEKYKSVQN